MFITVGTRFLLRPTNIFGLTQYRSLAILFVESGLEKLAAGHGVVFRALGLEHLNPRTSHPREWDSSEVT